MSNGTIEKIKFPTGNVYDIVDAGARELIAALEGSTAYLGVTTTALTDQATTNPIQVDGNSVTATSGNMVVYGRKEFIFDGTKWAEFGDLSSLGDLAYHDGVSVSLNGGTTGSFVNNIDIGNGKLVTTTVPNVTGNTNVTIPNVTSAGSASTWSFAMGTGNEATTLVISGGNGTAPTLGTPLSASKVTLGTEKTVATGAVSSSGTGGTVVTSIDPQTSNAVTATGTPSVTLT